MRFSKASSFKLHKLPHPSHPDPKWQHQEFVPCSSTAFKVAAGLNLACSLAAGAIGSGKSIKIPEGAESGTRGQEVWVLVFLLRKWGLL
jgi:hypothetical protein